MLSRLTLILRPATSYHAQIHKILRDERFDFQFGSLKQGEESGDVLLVTCVDFHDVGVVMEKLDNRIGVRCYLVDAQQRIFAYNRHSRCLTTLDRMFEFQHAYNNSTLTVGGNIFYFNEVINNG